ncbi:268_t:CDS:2 [Gigaspora margarita]|uniref:268_t:CDS:1 n=1 Tax=Gigaspora margarita TaxID=4874 RepID=A0ABN7UBY2_GIGMA|nr:268_t:CDS:2 [Gigaspora margarita]
MKPSKHQVINYFTPDNKNKFKYNLCNKEYKTPTLNLKNNNQVSNNEIVQISNNEEVELLDKLIELNSNKKQKYVISNDRETYSIITKKLKITYQF